jgi:transposase
LDKIQTLIRENEELPIISNKKLWGLLREMGFRWQKNRRKSVLIEKDYIVCWRRDYLRTIKKYREEGKTIFYLDETWLNEGHTVPYLWVDTNVKSSRQAFIEGVSTGINNIPVVKGRRLIITHIGNEYGFVNGGLLSFASKSTKDYHEEMTADVFEEYFEQMLDLIPKNSVIVMDNASYHSRLAEKLPTTAWKKGEIIEWLDKHAIEYKENSTKKELLPIVRQHKAAYKKYIIDEMALNRDVIILRLPPYHCDLNPIENIWSQVKGEVGRNNKTFKLEDLQQLLEHSLSKVTPENWKKCC